MFIFESIRVKGSTFMPLYGRSGTTPILVASGAVTHEAVAGDVPCRQDHVPRCRSWAASLNHPCLDSCYLMMHIPATATSAIAD